VNAPTVANGTAHGSTRGAAESGFVPLRVRSHGSLLDGLAPPEALIERALAAGLTALALTDRNNLYLAVRFMTAARAEGLHPITGADVTHASGRALLLAADRRGYARLCATLTRLHLDPHFDLAVALAEEPGGLHVVVESPGLAATLLAAGLAPARVAAGPLAGRSRGADAGLWMGVRGLGAEVPALAARVDAARSLGLPLVATGEVAMLDPRDHDVHRVAVTAARGELIERMPPDAFAAREAWFASPAEWVRRVRAVCARAGRPEAAVEALAHNATLVRRCRLELETGAPIFPHAPLPPGESGERRLRALAEAGLAWRYGVAGGTTGGGGARVAGPSDATAAGGSAAAARRRAIARLDEELAVIAAMDFTDYFLLVAEIVGFARERGIPTVGRGSGASSIVSYLLGITNVDPIRHGLHFERFLNPSRRDCPDLDIDLCWKRRDEVIHHVYQAYGADRVAMISTHATLGARSAFRETAKALGVPNARVNELARRIPRELEPPYAQRLATLPGARGVDWSEPPLAEALTLAAGLAGAPRHLSVHSGGLVIADRELTHYVPLERAAKDVVVTQFEMRAIEAIGLVKMDLLGNRALTEIGDCIALVTRDAGSRAGDGQSAPEKSGGEGRPREGGAGRVPLPRNAPDSPVQASAILASACGETPPARAASLPAHNSMPHGPARPALPSPGTLRLEDIPDDDLATAARVAGGNTLGCFQLESPAMRHLLRMMDARSLADTIAAVALIRPGPAGAGGVEGGDRNAKESFCRRRRGLERASFLHPRLEPVLRPSHGLMLYEEDVMRVAHAFAGLSLAQGDDLRRAIAHARDDEEFRSLERGFVAHARHAGADESSARAVWRELTRFAAYAFCHAHAAGYGTLGWHSAYLKTHFPVAWAVGVLNHHAGMYPTWVHVEDLRREGVRFMGPCVTRSELDATLEDGAVRVGLARVFALSAATAARIVRERAARRFASLPDFLERARPSADEIEPLVRSGALDALGRTRPSLLLEARVAAARGLFTRRRAEREPALEDGAGAALLPHPVAPIAAPELPEFAPSERVRGELESTGLWFSAHPLDVFVGDTGPATSAASLGERTGKRAALVGLLCAWRRVETRSGGVMLFATLADKSGVAECVLFPPVYRTFAEVMRASMVRVEGRVDETLGAFTLVVERAIALDGSAVWAAGTGAPPGTPGVRTHEVSRSRNVVTAPAPPAPHAARRA
jgi:DNA-directed DNA polymerase III PolC